MAGLVILDENNVGNFLDDNLVSGFIDQDGDFFIPVSGAGSIFGSTFVDTDVIRGSVVAIVFPPGSGWFFKV